MKKLNIIYTLMALMVAFTACNDEDGITRIPMEPGPASILSPNGSTTYSLIEENDEGAFETFIWEAAYFGTSEDISYDVQVDLASGDFTSPAGLGTTDKTYMTITTAAMNQVIRDLGVMAEEEVGLQVRVVATAGSDEKISIPVSMLVKRYIYEDEKPVWKVQGSALTEAVALKYDSDAKLWKSDGAITMMEGAFNFLNDNVYQQELGSTSDLVYAPQMEGNLTDEEGKHIPVKAYDYFVSLDAENMTFTVEEDNFYSLVGSAVVNEATRFSQEGSDMTMKTRLSAGTFQVKYNASTPVVYGATSNSDYTLIEGGVAIEIASDGDYSLTIDENMVLTVEESAYPAELYMTGGALNGAGDASGWNWDTNYAQFVPVHSHPELFWAIVWLDPSGNSGFKIAPQRAWGGDFGIDGDPVDGVWAKGGGNIQVPEANYYIVVVDLLNETVEANPANVYGMGTVFGGWDASNPANLFTIDKENKVIKYDGEVAEGELRMHVGAKTLACDWWQAEFIILNDMIEYRGTGGDQERVPMSAGNAVITLDFMNGTGSITQ
ncbi:MULTISPECIES: SusF/SusE family outer membrane protein [unclassified Carboxylicivirga]|uniref:SusF/SusE family outer membrane protein n=1 Tax=Carboxylicivirga TaxID=1628153 RepID=UPI003D324EE7